MVYNFYTTFEETKRTVKLDLTHFTGKLVKNMAHTSSKKNSNPDTIIICNTHGYYSIAKISYVYIESHIWPIRFGIHSSID